MEHLQHFGLKNDPFSNEPDLRFYFESASHMDAQRRVERGLRQRKGLTLLTGEGGMGKTLLARRILDGLEEEIFEATLLVMMPGAADATGTLQRFARQLGTDEPALDRAGLLGQIYEQLAIVREDGRHAILIVDDTQIMSSEVFAELAGLVNLEYEDRRLLSILFLGSAELDQMVDKDQSIAPRVDVRVRLQPLDLGNATEYLKHRLSAVDGDTKIVPSDAIDALFKFGRGRPRLLNTLADNALFEAYLGGRAAIDAADVERAAADLGVGPDPGSTYTLQPVIAGAPIPTPISPTVSSSPVAPVTTATPVTTPAVTTAEAVATDLLSEIELTSPTESEVETSESPTLDLDEGLEAALEDFGTDVEAVAGSSVETALSGDELLMEEEILPATPVADGGLDALSIEAIAEPVGAEIELTPIEADDADEADVFDDVFVELIEE